MIPQKMRLSFFADATKSLKETTSTLLHEAYHLHDNGWRNCQKSELFCMIMEKRHEVGGRALTREETLDILKLVKELYSDLPWR